MHQSFVTKNPTGPGNSWDFHFSLHKDPVYAQHCRDIFGQSPVKSHSKIPAGECEITQAREITPHCNDAQMSSKHGT